MYKKYDVVVVGGGHAGCEAAASAGKMGSSVLLISMNLNTIAQMSCNPAIGGVAKGQIVREIDALGGQMGIITDKTTLQFRMLNKSKGPAMWSPRAQCDRMRFAEEWRLCLEKIKNVDFLQEMVTQIWMDKNKLKGVVTSRGIQIESHSVILTNGTFMNGLIHIGDKKQRGGRTGESHAYGLTEQLRELEFESDRMKTGTPPRVDGRSLNYHAMEEQKGDDIPQRFSFTKNRKKLKKQKSCWITYTNAAVHEVLKKGLDQSPMFNGTIQSIGPRYCPSVEEKINRFSDKERHQIFVEPEGWNTIEIYVNGFSTSLPESIQYEALRKIEGFEKVKMFRPGYAIEYDFFYPTQLKKTLETKNIENLYFAGQINGTTGYEEAACQGLMAGINAHLKRWEKNPFIMNRSESYIGVLIDDLVTKGTDEPYRMFTSRAEYRLLLRQDNADLRLTEKGFEIGLKNKREYDAFLRKKNNINSLTSFIKKHTFLPDEINPFLIEKGESEITKKTVFDKILKRPNVGFKDFEISTKVAISQLQNYSEEEKEQVEIQRKYETYIEREKKNVEKMQHLEKLFLKDDFPYSDIPSLSIEAKEKLKKIKPQSLGQASRISGVSPADISVLLVYLGR